MTMACDCVAEVAEIVVLECCSRGVSADDSGDQLNDQIDDCIHGASLSLPRGGPCPPPLGHFRCAGAPRRRSALCITALERP